ncbi:unnamed protein product [Musa hybrid cultivar]
MLRGQYSRYLDTVIDQIFIYLDGIVTTDDGMDAWIVEVDGTCLFNLVCYKDKHFGGDSFDPLALKIWALRVVRPAIQSLPCHRKMI